MKPYDVKSQIGFDAGSVSDRRMLTIRLTVASLVAYDWNLVWLESNVTEPCMASERGITTGIG